MPATDNLLDLLGDRRVEEYLLDVRDQQFIVRFQPVVFFEDYSVDELFELHGKRVYEVSFARLLTDAEGRLVADYGTTGGGNAFYVLGTVAHAILGWAREHRPDYLFWWALDSKRQRLYSHVAEYLNKRGSGWEKLVRDPFTDLPSAPEVFWLGRENGTVEGDPSDSRAPQ